jgi:glycosyltransferase involved in cell wall biosynthesis
VANGKRKKQPVRVANRPPKRRLTGKKRSKGLTAAQLLQNSRHLSVIIPVADEEETIGSVLQQVKRLLPKEIIAIVNGYKDRTLEICLTHDVTCYSYPFTLGHDVGRAIGAREASGDVLLFLDGDVVFHAEELQPFVDACYLDVDIALNNVNPFYTDASKVDAVSMAKLFVNRMLLRPDLGYSSLTAIPHAMKKSVADRIGYENLVVPPKAQAMAILHGCRVEHVHSVNVFNGVNKNRVYNSQKTNLVQQLILGDHVEALKFAQDVKSERLFFSDQLRQRQVLFQLDQAKHMTDRHIVLPTEL